MKWMFLVYGNIFFCLPIFAMEDQRQSTRKKVIKIVKQLEQRKPFFSTKNIKTNDDRKINRKFNSMPCIEPEKLKKLLDLEKNIPEMIDKRLSKKIPGKRLSGKWTKVVLETGSTDGGQESIKTEYEVPEEIGGFLQSSNLIQKIEIQEINKKVDHIVIKVGQLEDTLAVDRSLRRQVTIFKEVAACGRHTAAVIVLVGIIVFIHLITK